MAEVLSQHAEEILLSMIVPEFHLLQVERELCLGDSVELDQALLSKRPEPLKSVHIDLPARVSLLVIDPHVTISAEHQSIIAAELVRVDDGSTTDCLDRQIQQRSRGDIPHEFDLHHTVSLENTEDRHLVKGAPAALPFPLSPEVRFVHFDLTPQEFLSLRRVGQDGQTDQCDSFQCSRIANPDLLGDLPGRDLELEKLDDPEPGFSRYPEAIDPASREVVEGIAA